MSHTLGPWVKEGWTVIADRKTRSRRGMVASCASAPMYESQWEANAHLIAAAPDLLEACKSALKIQALWYPIVESLENETEGQALSIMLNKFEQAIAKATP